MPLVGNDLNGDDAVLIGFQIEHADLSGVLERDFFFEERGGMEVEIFEVRELGKRFGGKVVGPEVDSFCGITIGSEIEVSVIGPEGLGIVCRIFGEVFGGVVFQVENPNVGSQTASVTFPCPGRRCWIGVCHGVRDLFSVR
ncbi:MAG: hypothetical protein RIS92_3233 [Verrucomicrobiota bacterium]